MLFFTFARITLPLGQSENPSDEAQIIALVEALQSGFAHRKALLIAEILADEFVFISPTGHYLRNKRELLSFLEEVFFFLPPQFVLEIRLQEIRWLRPDLAVGLIAGKDILEMNGQRIESQESGGITVVLEKGRWKIVHLGMVRGFFKKRLP